MSGILRPPTPDRARGSVVYERDIQRRERERALDGLPELRHSSRVNQAFSDLTRRLNDDAVLLIESAEPFEFFDASKVLLGFLPLPRERLELANDRMLRVDHNRIVH
jgi:hypothetical protein